jgi:hypothetical protein
MPASSTRAPTAPWASAPGVRCSLAIEARVSPVGCREVDS